MRKPTFCLFGRTKSRQAPPFHCSRTRCQTTTDGQTSQFSVCCALYGWEYVFWRCARQRGWVCHAKRQTWKLILSICAHTSHSTLRHNYEWAPAYISSRCYEAMSSWKCWMVLKSIAFFPVVVIFEKYFANQILKKISLSYLGLAMEAEITHVKKT